MGGPEAIGVEILEDFRSPEDVRDPATRVKEGSRKGRGRVGEGSRKGQGGCWPLHSPFVSKIVLQMFCGIFVDGAGKHKH